MTETQALPNPTVRAAKPACIVLLAVSFAWVACLAFSYHGYARYIIRIRHTRFRTEFEQFDPIVPQLIINDGNVLLKIIGAPLNSNGDWTVARYYYRGNYVACPHRFYVLPDDHPFTAREVIERGFQPGLAWYRAHHVTSILRVLFVTPEAVNIDAERAPE